MSRTVTCTTYLPWGILITSHQTVQDNWNIIAKTIIAKKKKKKNTSTTKGGPVIWQQQRIACSSSLVCPSVEVRTEGLYDAGGAQSLWGAESRCMTSPLLQQLCALSWYSILENACIMHAYRLYDLKSVCAIDQMKCLAGRVECRRLYCQVWHGWTLENNGERSTLGNAHQAAAIRILAPSFNCSPPT